VAKIPLTFVSFDHDHGSIFYFEVPDLLISAVTTAENRRKQPPNPNLSKSTSQTPNKWNASTIAEEQRFLAKQRPMRYDKWVNKG
jgi:hypothetical protein